MGEQLQDREIGEALARPVQRCPRLSRSCCWAGTASVSLEELHRRRSFDLDFHTRKAMADTRPILAEMQQALGDRFELVQAPDEHGSGFRGLLTLPSGAKLAVEVLSNLQDVRSADLAACDDADPADALRMRDLMLSWLKAEAPR